MATTTTLNWLRNNSAQYLYNDILSTHINPVLNAYNNIRIKSDVYTYDDGRTQLLLCLHAIWIVRDYPRHPPIAYVVPTNDMLVKPGMFVDVSGRCNIDYIQLWEKKSEGCNLSALLESMQDIFSTDPPLYAKPKLTNDPPPPPPKPIQSPPLPFQIPRTAPPPPNYQSNNTTIGRVWSPGNGPMTIDSRPQPSPAYHSFPVTGPLPPPVPTAVVHPLPPPPPAPPTPAGPVPNFLDEDSRSEPSTAPPRPPNPELVRLQNLVYEKINSEVASLSQALAIDADRLRAHQIDLLGGDPAIRDEMSRLEAVRDVCRNVGGRIRVVVRESEKNIGELRRKGEPEVDELVCSTSIVDNQLINLVAEDNAIEDTIYHLHRALNSGRIDLERFLRSTRILAEDQFMKRALIEKINSSI